MYNPSLDGMEVIASIGFFNFLDLLNFLNKGEDLPCVNSKQYAHIYG